MVVSTRLNKTRKLRLAPKRIILGSGMKMRYGGEGSWFSSLMPKLWDYGKKALPYILPVAASWWFNRGKSADQQAPPSQQLTGMVNNLNDKYGQFLPQELQDKLSLVNDPRVKEYLDGKPKKPARKPKAKPVEDDEDDEPETLQEKIYGEGLSKKNHKRLRSMVKGGGLYMHK